MTDLAVKDAAYIRLNWGRWVADCPSPFCHNALEMQDGTGWTYEYTWDDGLPDDARHGPDAEPGEPRRVPKPRAEIFQCTTCGTEAPLIWPADPEAIALITGYRPDVITRNWEPGELIEDLMVENAEHRCTPPEWEELAAASPNGQLPLLGTDEGRVTGGLLFAALEASRTPVEIEAAGHVSAKQLTGGQ